MLSLLLDLSACTTDTAPVDTADTGDTADTAEDTTPVWSQFRIESSSTINGIYASGSGVFAVGTGGFAWSGSGGDWTFMDIDVDGADITDLWGQGKNEDAVLAASTEGGTVAQYGGGSWTTGTMGDTSALKGVGGSDVSSLFAVGWGRAWSYDGAAWVYEAIPETGDKLNDVYGGGEKAFAVGDGGTSLVRQGGAWAKEETGVDVALNAVDGSGPTDVWAVGEAGTVLHNGGDGWKRVDDIPTTETLWAVFVPEEGVVYAVGSNGVAIRKMDGEWKRLYSGIDNILYSVHGATSTNVWASGNRGMVIQYKD
ncbi:MAG: hypothetical protein EXR71_00560 [Myxococcales bacterium]|nr:hypothetical protein [Myxococcales bacterium]